MKKIFLFIALFVVFLIPVKVFAEEPEEEVVEQEVEPTVDDFKAEVQEWLSQYMEESLVVKIITWLVDAGVLSALFVVYLKYRKHKSTTVEDMIKQFGDKIGIWLKDNFDQLSEEQIEKVIESINNLEKSNETIMKVLVLMQDNTAKGKAALIEYLGSKTDNAEVKNAVTEVNKVLAEQEQANAEVKAKVSGEYEEIF